MLRKPQSFGQKLWRILIPVALIILLLPLLVPIIAFHFLYRLALYALIWIKWVPKGKDILFVYSDSPIWHEYMTTELLPFIQQRAIVLNWSERKKWPRWSFAARVFYAFKGYREYSPLVILFRPLRPANLFRFWPAFKEWKHGHLEALEELRREFLAAL